MNSPVQALQRPPQKRREAHQRKATRIEPAAPTPRHLGEPPPQLQPHIQQDKAERKHDEPIGHIARGRPAAHLPRTAIATFDPKAPSILAPRLLWCQVKLDQDEEQPVRLPEVALGALGRREHPAYRQVHWDRWMARAGKGIARPIAVPPATEGA